LVDEILLIRYNEGMTVFHTDDNVGYLPLPNRVEAVLSIHVSDQSLTKTAFLLPVFPDGSIVLAQNQRRGLEIAGGHAEPGETLVEAAVREAFEEVGCVVGDPIPIGFLRMTCAGNIPEGYGYPYPVSFQQFFAAPVVEQVAYAINDECGLPVRIYEFDGLKGSVRAFCERARQVVCG
jgi:8-oxo-dGTP diphosphatase